jgi:hypothetical protein
MIGLYRDQTSFKVRNTQLWSSRGLNALSQSFPCGKFRMLKLNAPWFQRQVNDRSPMLAFRLLARRATDWTCEHCMQYWTHDRNCKRWGTFLVSPAPETRYWRDRNHCLISLLFPSLAAEHPSLHTPTSRQGFPFLFRIWLPCQYILMCFCAKKKGWRKRNMVNQRSRGSCNGFFY